MGELRVVNGRGDTKLMWDPSRPDEVSAARKLFDELKGKGHNAYAVKKKGEPGVQISKFDPAMGKIIMAPAMSGG